MSNNLPKDLAGLLKAFEGNLCGSCDKSDKARVRLACSRLACVGCVASEVCQICSELMDASSSRPRYGDTITEGAKHNSELTSNQDTSQLAVYQKQRISEQLRIEKELFPECIQAPAKYFNKRKSLNVSKGKENRHTVLPGELTSCSFDHTMNKSRNFVQEWLNKQPDPQPRSPFSDLKVNTHHNKPTHSTPLVNKSKQKENPHTTATRQSNRKRSRLKQTPTVSPVNLENYLKPLEKREKKAWSAKRLKQEFENTEKHVDCKAVCEESGIVIDDDCCSIEDTQDQIVDKDRMALLEVQKASVTEMSESVMVIGDTEDNHSVNEASTSITHDKEVFHVPFYKKSKLYESCTQCVARKEALSENKPNLPDNAPKVSKDVSITVENKSFIATISIVDCNPINSGKKQSAAVQTESQEPFLGFEQPTLREAGSLISKMRKYIETQDVDSASQVPDAKSQTTFCESISKMQDGSDKGGGNVEQEDIIKAGHSSEHEFGVLSALDGAGLQNRRRRAPRGATPDSNNSSDKENFDPNRRRKGDTKKKKRKYK